MKEHSISGSGVILNFEKKVEINISLTEGFCHSQDINIKLNLIKTTLDAISKIVYPTLLITYNNKTLTVVLGKKHLSVGFNMYAIDIGVLVTNKDQTNCFVW